MKLNGDNLAAQLNRELPTICLVTGDEPLLVGEASDQLRAAARSKGFTEREVFFVERGFNWQELRAATQAMSLFAEQRILEVRLAGASPGNDGSEVLCEIAHKLPQIFCYWSSLANWMHVPYQQNGLQLSTSMAGWCKCGRLNCRNYQHGLNGV